VAELEKAVQQAKNLKGNLIELNKILKRIAVGMANKPLQWLQEFNQKDGFQSIKTILLDIKTKYSNSYQPSQVPPQYSSLNATSTYQESLKDSKDFKLIHEIKHECMKILKSFANTNVCISSSH
jgi:hypothetical protein